MYHFFFFFAKQEDRPEYLSFQISCIFSDVLLLSLAHSFVLKGKIHTYLSYIWSSGLAVVDSLNLIILTEGLQHLWQQITALHTSQWLWTSAPRNTSWLHCCCCWYLDWSLVSFCINCAIFCGNGLVTAWDSCVVLQLQVSSTIWLSTVLKLGRNRENTES